MKVKTRNHEGKHYGVYGDTIMFMAVYGYQNTVFKKIRMRCP